MGGSPFTDASIPSQVAYPPGHRTLGAAQKSSIVLRQGSRMLGRRVSERDSERVIERVGTRLGGLLRNSAECRFSGGWSAAFRACPARVMRGRVSLLWERIQSSGRLMGMRCLPVFGAAVILAMAGCTDSPAAVSTLVPSTTPASSTTSAPDLDSTSTIAATAPATTQPPRPLAEYLSEGTGAGAGLLPSSQVEGDRSVIDLTFTDGRRVEVVYPSAWALDQYRWTPDTYIVYDFDEPRQDGSGAIHAQVLFALEPDGEWTMTLHPMSIWSVQELEIAKSNVTLHTESNGFVTVETTRPLSHFSQDPGQAPIAADFRGDAGMYVDDILGLASTDQCIEGPESPYPLREPNVVTWCDEDAGVIAAFNVPEQYHDEVLAEMDFRLITAGLGE